MSIEELFYKRATDATIEELVYRMDEPGGLEILQDYIEEYQIGKIAIMVDVREENRQILYRLLPPLNGNEYVVASRMHPEQEQQYGYGEIMLFPSDANWNMPTARSVSRPINWWSGEEHYHEELIEREGYRIL